jgi:hypothetical protein
MVRALPHIDWLFNTGERITLPGNREAEVWELRHKTDDADLKVWATHFRNHYCRDADLPALVEGTGLTHTNYLITMKFPDGHEPPGPSIRSGDFAEILIADYIEYKLGYWCPRELRYDLKWNRNESTKGCDVIGFKFNSKDRHDPADELFVFEAKARLTGKPENRLQDAVNDSIKDRYRISQSLNAIKQRFYERGDTEKVMRVQRFQDEADRPFRRISGAAAVLDVAVFDRSLIAATDVSLHPNVSNLRLVVVRGQMLMDLVHSLYERAANEA